MTWILNVNIIHIDNEIDSSLQENLFTNISKLQVVLAR